MSDISIGNFSLGPAAQDFLDKKEHKLFINGEWVDANGEEHFPTYDPASGNVIGQIAQGGACLLYTSPSPRDS